MRRSFLLSILILAASAAPALAQQANSLLNQSQTRWKAEDKCIADSITTYPDHDALSLHRRDVFVDKCLAAHHLPPRQHLAPGG